MRSEIYTKKGKNCTTFLSMAVHPIEFAVTQNGRTSSRSKSSCYETCVIDQSSLLFNAVIHAELDVTVRKYITRKLKVI